MADDLFEDLHQFLYFEDVKNVVQRAKWKYIDQLGQMRREKIYHGVIHEPVDAIDRVIAMERERGVGEDVLTDVERVLRSMREKMAVEIKEGRRLKKLERERESGEDPWTPER